ncbi:class I SAM-dependent methyltransferase [Desulfoluna sp.]|uniref:class I SAM-dependent methyltransferase n=1 Tax=Desulfoluna sp. TaxID=2045199 RepID=UPI00263862C0|nr:class I SAM-dependent methyltransferase [Desulfoluna sp.]
MRQNSEQRTLEVMLQCVDMTGSEVLEIGCGDGRLTSWLVGKVKHLTAIDPDGKCIETARKKVPSADFFVGSGEWLDFPDGRFDLVLFSLSLHHQDSRLALQEASRVLKDKGVVLVLEPLNEGGIEEICKVLHQEDQEKLEAQQAIAESDWVVHRREAFASQWVFETPEEMYQWVFDYYDTPFDIALAQQMGRQPGVDMSTRPVLLQEWQELQLLSKE